MTLVVLALAAGGIGAWLRRWWLLALPPAAAVGAGFLLVMPGSHVTSDNPLPFLLVVVEAALAIGIVVGGRLRNSAKEKACDPALSADGRGQSAGEVEGGVTVADGAVSAAEWLPAPGAQPVGAAVGHAVTVRRVAEMASIEVQAGAVGGDDVVVVVAVVGQDRGAGGDLEQCGRWARQ